MELFSIFLNTLIFIVSLQEHEKSLLSICFALFVTSNVLKTLRSPISMASFVLYPRQNIPNNTTPTFTEVGGVT